MFGYKILIPLPGLVKLAQLPARRLNAELRRWIGSKERAEGRQPITHLQTALIPLTRLVLLAQEGDLPGLNVFQQEGFGRERGRQFGIRAIDAAGKLDRRLRHDPELS